MKIAYSCVVDAHPKFEWQALLWVNSLLRNGCNAEDLKVHCLPGVTDNLLTSLRKLNVYPVDTPPFEGGPAYCNKMQQCISGAFSGYDKVVLADADLFFLALPQLPADASFAGKLVDMPNPPVAILRDIYREARVPFSKEVPVECALTKDETTFRSNINGGFYYLDEALLHDLGKEWKKHALWLISKISSGTRLFTHVDQVAMALALDEMKIEVTLLSAQINFPIHLDKSRLALFAATPIDVLHYHSNVLPSGEIMPTGVPFVDEAITRANREITAIIGDNTDNLLFWNNRYACFPELGSGVGSRGEILYYKKMLLNTAVSFFNDKAVLEVGCGDLETSKDFQFSNYVGYDLSVAALDIAKKKRPDWRFIQGTLDGTGTQSQADLVICLDVLIHQKGKEEYRNLIAGLVAATQQRLIVSGYEKTPDVSSNITAFHEPLSTTLRKSGVFNEIMEIGKYRDVSLLVADKRRTGRELHVSDLPPEIFNTMAPLIERRDLLRLIIDSSRAKLGFYTQTSSRTIEYPWLIDKMTELAVGSRVLDIGSGISPIPIMLGEHGMLVSCVDAHPRVRTLQDRDTWNEWGFLDYSLFSPRLKSFHTDIQEYQPVTPFDVIYSVSVLEHMPRVVWERTLDLAKTWLKPGGLLLLTLDLIPGTYTLWNKSEGKTVDPHGGHGLLKDIVDRLKGMGFVFEEFFARQNIPYSQTDVAFIKCRLRAGPAGVSAWTTHKKEGESDRSDAALLTQNAKRKTKETEKKKLFLHIGTPKTGTSALQHFLYKNHDKLKDEGILYPKSLVGSPDDPKHQPLYSCLYFHNRNDFDKILLKLSSEITDQVHTVILSSEGFYHHIDEFHKESWNMIRELSQQFTMRIVVSVRPQSEYIESLYRQYMKNPKGLIAEFGSGMTIQEVIQRPKVLQNMDYYGSLMQWAGVAGEDSIIVKRYSKNVISDFLSLFKSPLEVEKDFPHRNASINREMAELLRQLNTVLDAEKRDQLIGRMDASVRGKPLSRDLPFLSPTEGMEIMELHRIGNNKVARRWLGEDELFPAIECSKDEQWAPVITDRDTVLLSLRQLYNEEGN